MSASATLEIINKAGLHARAAALLVQAAGRFQARVVVEKDGESVNGKSIMGVMMLAATVGSVVTVTADGPDEAEAIAAISELVRAKFGEE